MSWAERLLRLAVGDPKREVGEQLARMRQRSADQAQRLAVYAAQAPTGAAETELHGLATERRVMTDALTASLQGSETLQPSAGPALVPNGGARNHWARLVAALEACRTERAETLRATPRLLELDPSLAQLLESALCSLDAELLALRAMIARADPQALN